MSASCAQRSQVEVVLDRQAEEESRGLEGTCEPQLRPRAGGHGRDVASEELDGSSCGRELAGDDVEEGRLAGAVRPEEGTTLARIDVEVDVSDGVDAPEAPADAAEADDRLGALGFCRCDGHECLGSSSSLRPAASTEAACPPRRAGWSGRARAFPG